MPLEYIRLRESSQVESEKEHWEREDVGMLLMGDCPIYLDGRLGTRFLSVLTDKLPNGNALKCKYTTHASNSPQNIKFES